MADTPPYPPLATVYCTDEAIAIRCNSDHQVLTPDANLVAEGSDGSFIAPDRWTLHSATVDFESQGVKPGSLVTIRDTGTTKRIRGSGSLLVAATIAGKTVTLRRIGMAAGLGQPPAPADGLTGVAFGVSTLAPQIEQASDELNRRFGIDPAKASREPDWIYDRRELEEATMLTVLLRQYTVDARTSDGDFPLKIREIKVALDAALSRLQLKWGPRGDSGQPASVFGMRMVRG